MSFCQDPGAPELSSTAVALAECAFIRMSGLMILMINPDIEAIELPEFSRKYVKQQRKGERTFSASGPKADLVLKHLIAGGFSADQIAEACECSVSRVRECMWALDAANIDYPRLARSAAAKPAADPADDKHQRGAPRTQSTEASDAEVVEAEVVAEPEKPKRTRKPRAAKAEA